MFSFTVDLGQLFIMCMIGIVGYFAKKELDTINSRLDSHDRIILDVVAKIGRLFGLNDRDEEVK